MKIQYKVQKFQSDAVDNIIRVFKGQSYHSSIVHRHDLGTIKLNPQSHFGSDDTTQIEITDDNAYMNHDVELNSDALLDNIRTIQSECGIECSKNLDCSIGRCSLDIDMETGTGKTFVYTSTMYELNKQYGWSKFIIVVPSIAIREGVKKSISDTMDYFMRMYQKKIRFFVYDSKNLHEIDDYTQSNDINVMIINNQAFAVDFESTKSGKSKKASRIIFDTRDEFGSRRPIDVIASNRPIIILDEPQKLNGSATQKVLREKFRALFSMNFSATHTEHHNLIYVFDAFDALKNNIVKKIEVTAFDVKNIGGAAPYLYFEGIVLDPIKPPKAKIEIEVKRANGNIVREPHYFDLNHNDIYAESKQLAQYKGLKILDINVQTECMSLTNGQFYPGDVVGNVTEKELRRLQIHATILAHLKKEQYLFKRGIKCLSLFFLDKVSNYRIYDDDGNQILGEYGVIFEQEYKRILEEQWFTFDKDYIDYIQRFDLTQIHEGYFSIDKKNRFVESSTKNEGDEEIAAYEKILSRKDILLSMDEPIRFIFSHSALREGWDNQNIFQICALKHTDDSDNANNNKRQEVGRGLRLCINQEGKRMDYDELKQDFFDINKLTVIASENYRDFVSGLQEATKNAVYIRHRCIDSNSFAERTVVSSAGIKEKISATESRSIYNYLVGHLLIDNTGWFKPEVISDVKEGNIPSLAGVVEPGHETAVSEMLRDLASGVSLDSIAANARKAKIYSNPIKDENFKEFQAIWKRIQSKYAYYVSFDSEELIGNAVKAINDELVVSKIVFIIETGEQQSNITAEEYIDNSGLRGSHKTTEITQDVDFSGVKYDLIGEIVKRCKLRRKTVGEILMRIEEKKFDYFKNNPEEFISSVSRLINEQKAAIIVEHISYKKSEEDPYDSDIFTLSKSSVDADKIFEATKHITRYVITDGVAKQSIERTFAESLDKATEVRVYAKLPKGFSIPTPVGSYSPDWAIVFNEGSDIKHIYFIAETKGSMSSTELRGIEKAKTDCAKVLFNKMKLCESVSYGVVKNYGELLKLVRDT